MPSVSAKISRLARTRPLLALVVAVLTVELVGGRCAFTAQGLTE